MGDDGSSIRRVAGLHPTEEGQEGGRVLWYAMVRPRCELELTNLPLLTRTVLERTERCGLDMVVGVVVFGVTDQPVLFVSTEINQKGVRVWCFRKMAGVDMVHCSRLGVFV